MIFSDVTCKQAVNIFAHRKRRSSTRHRGGMNFGDAPVSSYDTSVTNLKDHHQEILPM